MPTLILNINFIKKEFIFGFPGRSNLSYQFTFVHFYPLHHIDLVIAQLSTFIKLLV